MKFSEEKRKEVVKYLVKELRDYIIPGKSVPEDLINRLVEDIKNFK